MSQRTNKEPLVSLIGMIFLALGLLLVKWSAFVQYVEQRHHLFFLPEPRLPAYPFPTSIGDFIGARDQEIIRWQNTLLAHVDRKTAAAAEGRKMAEARPPIPAPAPAAENPLPEQSLPPIVVDQSTRVLFCGDSLMQGLAVQMSPALKKRKIIYKDISRQSTGLTYPSFFDWPKTIASEIGAGNVNVLIIFLGANDGWDMYQRNQLVRFNSEEWRLIYTGRVEAIAQMAAEANIPLIWVGLPPMENKRLVNKVPLLNEIFLSVAQRHRNVFFIPSAPSLTEDGSTYTLYKRSPDGSKLRTRADDGIHLTPTGSRLLAEEIWSHVQFQ